MGSDYGLGLGLLVQVIQIQPKETYQWLLEKHYAKRIPQIMHSFGLYVDGALKGVVTYGIPASPALCMGICGKEYSDKVLELNRLCLMENNKNESSFLVSHSIQLLPKPTIVVSYADTSQGHVGYVYQATNFLYTGLSANRVDWTIKGMEHKHSKTISDGMTLESIKEKYGDDFYYTERSRKHRYIFFHGSKTDKKIMRKLLKYNIEPYPKGNSQKYDSGGNIQTQQVMFI
jgi:hypothetical protein